MDHEFHNILHIWVWPLHSLVNSLKEHWHVMMFDWTEADGRNAAKLIFELFNQSLILAFRWKLAQPLRELGEAHVFADQLARVNAAEENLIRHEAVTLGLHDLPLEQVGLHEPLGRLYEPGEILRVEFLFGTRTEVIFLDHQRHHIRVHVGQIDPLRNRHVLEHRPAQQQLSSLEMVYC